MVGAAEKRQQGPACEPTHEEADGEAGDDAGEAGFDLLHVEQAPSLAADEDEADLEQYRKEHEEWRGDPDAARGREDRPGRDEQKCDGGLGEDRDARQWPAADCSRHRRRDQRPDHGDADVGERKPLRAVGVEEDRVRDDQEQRLAEAECERLARQSPTTLRGAGSLIRG